MEEVRPHEPALRAYLHHSFPTLHDLDDLVQETYARLLRAKGAGKVGHARSYFFATARNAALDLFRRGRVVSIAGIADIERLGVLEDRPNAAEAVNHDQELEIRMGAVEQALREPLSGHDRARHAGPQVLTGRRKGRIRGCPLGPSPRDWHPAGRWSREC
jgi:RNA polymerase sigma factor (sigma-70 family)